MTLLGRGSRLIGAHHHDSADARGCRPGASGRVLPRRAAHDMPARQRRVGLQELGLPYAADPAVTRHLARFLSRQAEQAVAVACGGPARAERACLSDPCALQRRRDEGAGAPGAGDRGVERLAAAPRASIRSTTGTSSRRRISIMPSHAARPYYGLAPTRPRHPHPQRRPAHVLRRHRERDAGGPGHAGSAQGLVRRPVRDGGRDQRVDPEPGVRAGRRRTGRVPLPRRRPSASRIRSGALIEDWGDDLEELSPLDVMLHVDGQQDVVRAGHARKPRHRDGHDGTLVRVARPDAAMEAGVEHPGA